LLEFVIDEHERHTVYPPRPQTFRAFELTPYDDVKVVILGQDPYPNPGQAHGLACSVPAEVSHLPGSLRNIHNVLVSDLSQALGRSLSAPQHGSLEGWAEQGVLLLNTALTVRAGSKADRVVHRRWVWDGQGWSTFTDAVISAVSDKADRVVFILWGNEAGQTEKLIDQTRHAVIHVFAPISAVGVAGVPDQPPVLGGQQGTGKVRTRRNRLGESFSGRLTNDHRIRREAPEYSDR